MHRSINRQGIWWGAAVLTLCSATACDRPVAPRVPDQQIVTVWGHHGRFDEYTTMLKIVEAFNEVHDDLEIRITFFPDRQYPDKVSIAAAAGSLPDVIDIDAPYVAPWADEGLLQPFGDLVPANIRDDMLDSLVEQGTYRGKLYALGAFESALVVYYNRAIVQKAGLSPPTRVEDAWTWDEFVSALHRVKPHVDLPLSLHMDDPLDEWFTYAFAPLVWSNGGQLIDVKARRTVGVLDSARNVDALTRWSSLFREGLAAPTSPMPSPFTRGLAAFDWTGHWMLPAFKATDGLDFGVMPLPRMGDTFATASGSWCWGMSRDCRDRNAAWKVIHWFIHPEQGVARICKVNDAVPGRRSAYRYFPEYDEMPRRLFREQVIEGAHPRPDSPAYLVLTDAFAEALRDIGYGAEVQETLSRAARRVQRVLDRHARLVSTEKP